MAPPEASWTVPLMPLDWAEAMPGTVAISAAATAMTKTLRNMNTKFLSVVNNRSDAPARGMRCECQWPEGEEDGGLAGNVSSHAGRQASSARTDR